MRFEILSHILIFKFKQLIIWKTFLTAAVLQTCELKKCLKRSNLAYTIFFIQIFIQTLNI